MILEVLISCFLSSIVYAAYCNAIMDLISPKDLLADRGYKWSKVAMEDGKDRNHDGRLSFFEEAWPDDKWHEHKRMMFFFLMLASSFAMMIGSALVYYYPIKLACIGIVCIPIAIILFFVLSASFEFFYTRIKK